MAVSALDSLVALPAGRLGGGVGRDLNALIRAGAPAHGRPGAQPPERAAGVADGHGPGRAQGLDSDPAAVRKAATLLESHFLTMLLQEMRTPMLDDEAKEGYFTRSREERLFTRHLDLALGDLLAERGPLGLAELIVRQLLPAEASQVSDPGADT